MFSKSGLVPDTAQPKVSKGQPTDGRMGFLTRSLSFSNSDHCLLFVSSCPGTVGREVAREFPSISVGLNYIFVNRFCRLDSWPWGHILA